VRPTGLGGFQFGEGNCNFHLQRQQPFVYCTRDVGEFFKRTAPIPLNFSYISLIWVVSNSSSFKKHYGLRVVRELVSLGRKAAYMGTVPALATRDTMRADACGFC